MSDVTNKLERLATLIETRKSEIDNLRSGLTKTQIQQKTAGLPFEFSEELYALYQWRNGIERDCADDSPFLFGDRYLSNLDDAVETYFALQTTFVTQEEQKIADWSMCFPFANFDGSYLLVALGEHILVARYKHPIINIFEGIHLWFYLFNSMLDTCIEWNQQSVARYDTPRNELEIWEKHNLGVFKIDLWHM